jgi:hypothetical protein
MARVSRSPVSFQVAVGSPPISAHRSNRRVIWTWSRPDVQAALVLDDREAIADRAGGAPFRSGVVGRDAAAGEGRQRDQCRSGRRQ